jgi:pimeloyl-ACP methyl ester carboxylesterase
MASPASQPPAPSETLIAAEQAVLQATGIPIERREVEVNGVRLHYLTCGEGDPLVLLHGRGASAAMFAPVLPLLAARRQVFALDLPGWGLSGKPPFRGRTAQDALRVWREGLLGFLDSQSLAQPDIAGHSMGGFTALSLALEQPDRVNRLALVDAAGLGTQIQLDERLYFGLIPEKLHRRFGRRLTRLVMSRGYGDRARPDLAAPLLDLHHQLLTQEAVIPSGAAAFHTWVNFTGVHYTLTDRLKELRMPVLMMWGDRDSVTNYHEAFVAARTLWNGQMVAFTGCGHSPFAERPDDFARVLLTWLDNVNIPTRL